MPDDPVRDDPQKLLEVGTKMMSRLVTAVQGGYAKGDTDEDTMIMTIFDGLVPQEPRQTSAMCMAAIFHIARAGKWDLVLANADATRVVIPCDTEEEQTARALEIMKRQ